MSIVKIKDKTFQTSISEATIQERISEVAARINHDMEGRTPIFLSVLNGAFMFTSDLMKQITIPCELSFVKLASYEGVISTGKVKEVIGLNVDIAGRDIANPLGTILSAALLLRHSLGLEQEAQAIESAVSRVLDEGYRTADIRSEGTKAVGCTEMGALVAERI